MSKKAITGTITFIQHEKGYATIEYFINDKKKTINGNISEKEQQRLQEAKLIKKAHSFKMGDAVNFEIVLSAKGDRMIADNIEFLFNNAYSNLLNKAKSDNQFVGYLKKIDDKYFVKETGSYISFPLLLSAWEKKPHETRLNEPVFFKLNNIDKKNNHTASLLKSEFIPAYITAQRYFKNKTAIEAQVYKVTPHALMVHIINGAIEGRLPLLPGIQPGDTCQVRITHLTPFKIVLERL